MGGRRSALPVGLVACDGQIPAGICPRLLVLLEREEDVREAAFVAALTEERDRLLQVELACLLGNPLVGLAKDVLRAHVRGRCPLRSRPNPCRRHLVRSTMRLWGSENSAWLETRRSTERSTSAWPRWPTASSKSRTRPPSASFASAAPSRVRSRSLHRWPSTRRSAPSRLASPSFPDTSCRRSKQSSSDTRVTSWSRNIRKTPKRWRERRIHGPRRPGQAEVPARKSQVLRARGRAGLDSRSISSVPARVKEVAARPESANREHRQRSTTDDAAAFPQRPCGHGAMRVDALTVTMGQMQRSYGVVWREGSRAPVTGKLELLPRVLRLEGLDSSRDVPYEGVAAIRVGRSPSDRINGGPSVMVEQRIGDTIAISTVAQPSMIGEIAERLAALQLGARPRRRVVVIVPLKPGVHGSVSRLLKRGPPFDPAAMPGLNRHEVFLTSDEAVFVF